MDFNFNSIKQNNKIKHIGITQDKKFIKNAFIDLIPGLKPDQIDEDLCVIDLKLRSRYFEEDFIFGNMKRAQDFFKKLYFELKLEPWSIKNGSIEFFIHGPDVLNGIYESGFISILDYLKQISGFDISEIIENGLESDKIFEVMKIIERNSTKFMVTELVLRDYQKFTVFKGFETFRFFSPNFFLSIPSNVKDFNLPEIHSDLIILEIPVGREMNTNTIDLKLKVENIVRYVGTRIKKKECKIENISSSIRYQTL